MNVSITVIIPLYNKAAYVRRALDSVLAQTHRDFEVIVVDDGSTDGSADVVREITDPRIRLIRQPNAGVSAARNRGVAEAQTDWVAFLDADDEWYPELLEKVIPMARTQPSAVAVFANLEDVERGAPLLSETVPSGIVEDYLQLFVDNDGRGMHSSSIIVKKETLRSAGGFPVGVKFGEDIDTWTRLAWSGDVAYVSEVLGVYHSETAGSAMKSGAQAFCNSHESSIASYEQWKQQGRIPQRLAASSILFKEFMYARHAGQLSDAGDNRGARRILRTRCTPGTCGYVRYWKIYIRSLIPQKLLALARRWRNRGR